MHQGSLCSFGCFHKIYGNRVSRFRRLSAKCSATKKRFKNLKRIRKIKLCPRLASVGSVGVGKWPRPARSCPSKTRKSTHTCRRIKGGVAKLVISLAFLGVRQYFISLVYFFKFSFGIGGFVAIR